MTVLEKLTPADVARAVESHPRLGRAVSEISRKTGLPEEVVRSHLTEALTETLERLGDVYLKEMGSTIAAVDHLRDQVHQFYDRVLSGQDPNPDTAALSGLFTQLHEKMLELNDPQKWAKKRLDAGTKLPATGRTEPTSIVDRGAAEPKPREPAPKDRTTEPAPTRMEAVQQLVRKAQAKIAELDSRLAESRRETTAARSRTIELNRDLRQRGVDLARLSDDRYVSRLPEDVRALVDERAQTIEGSAGAILEREALQRERAMWNRVSTSDVVQRRYAELRGRTPDAAARSRSAAAEVDVLGRRRTPDNPFEPDHTVSVMEVVAMDDFVLLPDEVALDILNDPEGIEPMNKSANASKSDWTWEEWPQWAEHADASLRNLMIAREAQLRSKIRARIQVEVARLRATAR
ncbi:MAG: hypothetical protein ACJ74O_18190 [Frankiaceae bacterium]